MMAERNLSVNAQEKESLTITPAQGDKIVGYG
jgi:hypothetical protein